MARSQVRTQHARSRGWGKRVLGGTSLFLVACAAACAGGMGEANYQPDIWGGGQADAAWPPGEVLTGYRRAADLYKSGRTETAIRLVTELSTRPLRVGPDSVWWDEERFYTVYYGGRLLPTLARMRQIFSANEDRSANLSQAGLRSSALQVLCLNLRIATQAVHAEPPDVLWLLLAVPFWEETWKRIGEQMARDGDKEKANAATACAERARQFRLSQIRPFVQQLPSVEEAEPAAALAAERRRVPRVRELAELWHKRVEDPSCRCLISGMEGPE